MSMNSELYIPILNGLQFVDVDPPDSPLYATKHIDNWLFADQLYKFQGQIPFLQPWLSQDIVRLQFESNFTPLQLDLYDQYGRRQTGYSASATQVRANRYMPGFFVYEATLTLAGLGRGPYRYIITPGNDTTKRQKSEWFIIAPNYERTILLKYWNSYFHGDVVFETGIQFTLRIPGYIEYDAPGNKVVTFENQPLNQTVVSAKRFRQIILHVGDGSGVPPWMIDKINAAWCCNNVELDNKPFALTDGKWNVLSEDDNALKGYSMNIREGINRSSKIITGTGDPLKKITIISNIDGRLYSDVSANAGETVIQILNQG